LALHSSGLDDHQRALTHQVRTVVSALAEGLADSRFPSE
jgi:hypothetical protein